MKKYYWLDVGNPTTYLWANWDMLRLYGYPIEPAGVRQGNSHVWYLNNEHPPETLDHGKNVCFGSGNTYGVNCEVSYLSVIGSNISFGDSCKISRSVIWDNCKFGVGVHVDNSVIANDVIIADNCIIRSNSIIGPNCKILKKYLQIQMVYFHNHSFQKNLR